MQPSLHIPGGLPPLRHLFKVVYSVVRHQDKIELDGLCRYPEVIFLNAKIRRRNRID